MDALERIASALERIADALETNHKHGQSDNLDTPFPWHEVSVRARRAEARNRRQDRTTTVEMLIKIGRHALLRGEWKNFGNVCVQEIDHIMQRLGFWEQWERS